MNTFERVQMVVAKQLAMPPEGITAQTDLVSLCNEESLAVMELLLAIEDEFDLPLADDTEGMRTVQQVVDVIERQGVGSDQA